MRRNISPIASYELSNLTVFSSVFWQSIALCLLYAPLCICCIYIFLFFELSYESYWF